MSTSVTAFVGAARRGPLDKPTQVHSFADYERIFGRLWEASRMSFAVRQYFQNGGREAVVVRVAAADAAVAEWAFKTPGETKKGKEIPGKALKLIAAGPGAWGSRVSVKVEAVTADASREDPQGKRFNLIVIDEEGNQAETHRNLSIKSDSPAFVKSVLEQRSRLLRVATDSEATAPPEPTPKAVLGTNGKDGKEIGDTELVPAAARKGVNALEAMPVFNLLCLPGAGKSAYREAVAFLEEGEHRAMLIVDAPREADPAQVKTFQTELNLAKDRAALYFPRLLAPNPLKGNAVEEFAPCGAVAGIFARTDAQRGIWKAPAGTEARFVGVDGPAYVLTDKENGELNPLAINCIRALPQAGTVVWGSRTLRGADALADPWRAVPVRRLAHYLEDSLERGLTWTVFEPNDAPLWGQIRLNVGAFMNGLFRQGAFQGSSARQAYFVKCDAETTTQDDIDRGVVNIRVGFAPLKPAEFVVLAIQQMAGQEAA